MISTAGAHRALTVDLHADQIQGFFDIPVDNIYASPVLLGDIWRKELTDPIVVSPDVGGVVRARAVAKQLDDAELAIIDKRRPRANEAQVMNIIGEVRGRTCVIVDDIADNRRDPLPGGASPEAAGARSGCSPIAPTRFSRSPQWTTSSSRTSTSSSSPDTIPLDGRARECPRIRRLSIAELLAESILRICTRPLGRGALHGVGPRGPGPSPGPAGRRGAARPGALPGSTTRQPLT